MKLGHFVMTGLLACAFAWAPAGFAAAPASGTQTHPSSKTAPLNHGKHGHYTQAQIKSLQQALTAKGFAVAATGEWNQSTRDAIKAFQAKNHLKVTGHPNAKTRKALGLDW